jgi:3-phenylpropionate/trans-cinnamate dioxygenase ferredoxin reductase subunit
MLEGRVVVVGAGQAGGEVAIQLRRMGWQGHVTVLGAETAPPYQRPPLSKKYLAGQMATDDLWLRPRETFAEERIALGTGERVVHADLDARAVTTGDGEVHAFDHLVFATGSTPRRIALPGAELGGVHVLRSITDVDGLRPALLPGARLVIVGAGYIGLEVAAVARGLDVAVTVLEAAPRVLARVTGPEMSAFYDQVHRDAGVDVRTGARLEAFEGDGQVAAVRLADGQRIEADVVLVAIGIVPDDALARASGVHCEDGIVVDADARTSAPGVYAIGDCARRPLVHYDRRLSRLESVHNALEQAKLAAAAITGAPRPTEETPWFWSDQYDLKLQIAGISAGADRVVLRGDPGTRRFAAFSLAAGRLIAVDAVNAPAEFMAGRKLIAQRAEVAPERLADTSVSMKDILGAG